MTTTSLPTTKTPSTKLNLQLLMKIKGDKSKSWWNASVVMQIAIILLSAYSTLTSNFATETTLILIPFLSICAPLMRWRSDYIKGEYQSILRKFEFFDGLGWVISPRERSEWLLTLSTKKNKQVTASERMPQHYFTSNKSPSVARLLENLEESSWWSKHLARFISLVFGAFTAGVLLFSFGVLFLSIQGAVSQSSLVNIAKVVVSVIAALFSIGFIRLTVEYAMFSLSSAKFEDTACKILDAGKAVTQDEATKLLQEYQIARSGAPMLPNWAWRIKQKALDSIWKEQRCRN